MLGDFTPGKTIVFDFNTHKADGTPITLAGTPAISVYKNSTTESTAGVTLTVDYDSRTGMHHVVIDTSADGTFYAAGNDFRAVITAGTVDSISVVGTVVGAFSLSNRSALRPATADRTLVVDAAGLADANTVKIGPSGSGTAQTAVDAGARLDATVSSRMATYTQPTGFLAATFPTTVASTTNITAGTITTVTNLTNAPTNGDFTATMKASITTAVPTAAAIATQVWTDLVSGSDFSTASSVGKLLKDNIDTTVSSRLASASYSAPPSAATISTQVQADLGTGAALTSLAPAATALSTVVWTPTMAGYLDAAVSSRLASASYTAPLDASGVRTAVGLASANLDTQLDALPTAAENSTAVWAAVTRSLTDKAGFSLATAPPTADENAAALLDLANAIESGLTVRQAMRLIVAADAGKVSGGGTTTVTIRDIADTKDRIVATVDSDGNRTAITRDLT